MSTLPDPLALAFAFTPAVLAFALYGWRAIVEIARAPGAREGWRD